MKDERKKRQINLIISIMRMIEPSFRHRLSTYYEFYREVFSYFQLVCSIRLINVLFTTSYVYVKRMFSERLHNRQFSIMDIVDCRH